jgi:hypothetical protein
MFIGQHYLEGSLVTLKNPIIMVEKKREPTPVEVTPPGTADSSIAGGSSTELSIEGYVRKKIIFKTRPKPVGLLRVLK